MKTANLRMPWPIVIQTGVVALVAPSVTDSIWGWLAVVGASLLGWIVLLLFLLGLAKGGSDVRRLR